MMDCAICFERINIDQKLLRCGHQFHGECVDQWFYRQKRRSCPLCRTPVTPKRRNDPAPERTVTPVASEDEEFLDEYEGAQYEEDQYGDDQSEEEELYENVSDEEMEYSDMITEDEGEVTIETNSSASASAPVTVDETMDLEAISSNESFFVEQQSDTEESEGEELAADGQTT